MALKRKKPVRLLLILVLTLLIVLSLLSARVTSETYSQLHHLHIGSGLGDRFFDIIHEWSSSSAKTNTIANVSNRDVINVPPQEKTKTSLDERDSAKKTAPAGKARAERFPWFVNESSRHPEAVHHVVFVKVHKAASTTVFNIFIRFAMSRQLNVMFPRQGNILSQGKPGLRELAPHPKPPPFHFDILCNHVIFNYKTISPYFPPDTKYVAIVRDPWTQVQSAYYYYTTVYPTAYIKKAFNLEEFIHKQSQYEPRDPFKSFTNNRMSIDLGLPPSHVTNSSYVIPFLRHLDSVFHLVLIAERFDESMVLMKRLFGWTMKDIVYRKLNTEKNPQKKTEGPVPDLEKQFKRFHHFDVAVYEHYTKIFNQKIENEGPDFADELETFVCIRKQICEFCDGKLSGSELVIFRSKWNEQVVVRRAECAVLSVGELTLNTAARKKQIARLLHTSNAHLVS